ncbi:MAG: hypothetical protein CVV34_04585, partial [Methanomicrobiales archaeon HGW-Methanomicrobiales-5]
MPAYYFAMEGYHTGEKPDPTEDKLITIQYQKIDLTSGEPLGELTILKEWESSEKEIITTFYNQFFKPDIPVTHFIPVGMNLDYEFEMMIAKLKKYHLPVITSYQLYYQRPRFELRPIVILLNDGRFAGARLDAFSSKKYDGSHMKKWYEKAEFKRIEYFIREETEAFLKLLQYLNNNKHRIGITKKGVSGSPKTEESPVYTRQEKAPIPQPKSFEPEVLAPKKRTETWTSPARRSPAGHEKPGAPSFRKSSSGFAKAESRPS